MGQPLSRKSYDVVIVGSGPAGSSAALCLARRGVTVAMLEKASLPRYKTCGGAVVHRAIRLLPVDIREAVQQECYSVELHLLDARLHFSTQRPEPIISMTMREKFDFVLASAAKAAGVDVRSHCEVLDVVMQADRVKLVTTQGPLVARFVVAADGATGVVARKAGWQETRTLIPALECEVSVNDDVLRRFIHAARFDFGVVPHGYAWVFPKKEHLSIGALTTRRGVINLRAILEGYMKRIGIDRIQQLERHGFLIPVRPRTDSCARRRVLLTGDAAGFADPLTAEGITFAIQSGQMAATALLEGGFDEARVKQAYEGELARHILPELRWGRALAQLVYTVAAVRTALFRLYGQRLCEAMTGVFLGETTYRQILRNPRNYLQLLRCLGRSPGAEPLAPGPPEQREHLC